MPPPRHRVRRALVVVAWLMLLPACSSRSTNPLVAATPCHETFEGAVEAQLEAGAYGYVSVRVGEQQRWVATLGHHPRLRRRVRVEAFACASGFESPRLNRRFSPLWFGRLANVAPEP